MGRGDRGTIEGTLSDTPAAEHMLRQLAEAEDSLQGALAWHGGANEEVSGRLAEARVALESIARGESGEAGQTDLGRQIGDIALMSGRAEEYLSVATTISENVLGSMRDGVVAIATDNPAELASYEWVFQMFKDARSLRSEHYQEGCYHDPADLRQWCA